MRLCGQCVFYPEFLSRDDLTLIEGIVEKHNSEIFRAWLEGRNLRDASKKPAAEKVRFKELNRLVWCRQEKFLVRACEFACFAWKPREESSQCSDPNTG